MNTSHLKTKGFTLIETLVAVGIFAFSITGLISVTARGVFDTNFVKNKFTAGYLALEGAELARTIRDTAGIQNIPWGTVFQQGGSLYLSRCIRGDDEACSIDPWSDPLTVLPCPSGGCPAMTYNTDTGQFGYEVQNTTTVFASVFSRTIYVTVISPSEVKVTSEVSWMQGTRPHKVTYSYYLHDWIGP